MKPGLSGGVWPVKKSSYGSSSLGISRLLKTIYFGNRRLVKRPGTVLSQKVDNNEVCIIIYASRSLCPSEKSMCDYSSATIELMALKWSIWDKFKDYLLGSKFNIFTENNPLCYIKSSKLEAAQIRWLSELALYNFDIVYCTEDLTWLWTCLVTTPK